MSFADVYPVRIHTVYKDVDKMKTPARILLVLLSVAVVVLLPVLLSSPAMVTEYAGILQENYEEALEEEDDEDEEDTEAFCILDWFISTARAEEDSNLEELTVYELPMDFTVPPVPDPAAYTEDGYEDESISVKMETLELDGVVYRVARVTVSSPSQLRTAVVGKPVAKGNNAHVIDIANGNNAIVAINSDFFRNDPDKTSFEYRQGTKIRANSNSKKDKLIIDTDGNFHTFFAAKGKPDFPTDRIYQAFTFGPVLIHEGELNTDYSKYISQNSYNTARPEPRTAIGQTGELSYLLVVAEGRGESAGATVEQVARFMLDQGCTEAFNLDGGNSCYMVFNNEYYNTLPGAERSQSDIIYFATAIQ